MTNAKLDTLLASLHLPNVQAFLRVIRAGESHETDDEAYAALYGWRPGNGRVFTDFGDHPRQASKTPWGWTSAAGAFQAMCAVPPNVKTDTWGDFVRWCAGQDYRPMFGQDDQRLFAVWCIARRGALADVVDGRVDEAIRKCAREWASLPGSPYGQPTLTMARALAVWRRWGGTVAGRPPPATEPTTPAMPVQEQPMSTAETIRAVATAALTALNPIAGALVSAFDPIAQDKIERELARHTDRPEVAAQVSAAIVEAAKAATGKDEPIEAVVAARADPTAVAQVQQSALDEIERLAPLLERLAAIDRQALADDEASRQAAAQRAAAYGRPQDAFLTRWAVWGLYGVLVGGGGLAAALAYLGRDPQMLVGALLPIIGVVAATYRTRFQPRVRLRQQPRVDDQAAGRRRDGAAPGLRRALSDPHAPTAAVAGPRNQR